MLSSLVSRLTFSCLLSLSLSVCLRVLLCVVLRGCCCFCCGVWCVWRVCVCVFVLCVVVCVRCGVVCGVTHWKKPCVESARPLVYVQHVPVCTGTTHPHKGNVLILHTGEREGERRETKGGSPSVLLTEICPHWLSRAPDVHRKKRKNLTHFQYENSLRTTCSLQSFALPDKVVQLQLS